MEGNIRFVSAGEITEGMWITLGNLRPITRQIVAPSGEKVEVEEKDMNPYLKGAPFRVLEVARPLLLLENWCQIPNVPPAVIWDTRLADFIEVSDKYAQTYRQAVYPVAAPSPLIEFSDAQLMALKTLADTFLRNAAAAAAGTTPPPPSPPNGGAPIETDPKDPSPIIGGDFGPPDDHGDLVPA